MGEIEARGELVLKEFAPLESLLKKLQGGDSASRWLEALKSEETEVVTPSEEERQPTPEEELVDAPLFEPSTETSLQTTFDIPRERSMAIRTGQRPGGEPPSRVTAAPPPVRAVADGVVIRALVGYRPLTAAQAEAWDTLCHNAGYTPDEVLDGYRGRQVWIDHGGGLVSRYAHLGSIADGIVVGATVVQGQPIATVGNSGTPRSVDSQTYDVHLHLELWLGDHYIGQFLRPIEAREWVERILR